MSGRLDDTQTFASCLVMKSIKPKPRWLPEPVAFFGRRTVFNSPNVLKSKKKQKNNYYITELLHWATSNCYKYVSSSVQVWWLPEEFPKFPDGGLERNVAHKDFGSCLFLFGLLLLAWRLTGPARRKESHYNQYLKHLKLFKFPKSRKFVSFVSAYSDDNFHLSIFLIVDIML